MSILTVDHRSAPSTAVEAFALALELAITAPTQAKSLLAVQLAESLAMGLTPEQVEAVKLEIGNGWTQ